jgi:sterol 24-C-methyltransferase
MTPEWDPKNPVHKQIAHEIEISSGIPEMRRLEVSRRAFDNVGFEVLHEEDLADRPDPIPWYYPLEGDIWKAQTMYDLFMCWRISWSGRLISHSAIWFMEKVGLMPAGTVEVTEQLKHALKGIVDGGKTKVCSVRFAVVYLAHSRILALHPHVPRRREKTGIGFAGRLFDCVVI